MRLKGFDLNQLVCLEALLAERNVTRAAQRVHLSQSAMSTVLGQLRTHFGDPLLVRSGRQLMLTPFAKQLIAPLSDLLSRAHTFTALAPDLTTTDIDRELKIVASDYTVSTFLSEAIQRIGPEMPNLRFDILPLTSQSSTLLDSGEVDLLLAGQALNVGRTPNECLFEDRFCCLICARKGKLNQPLSRLEYMSRRHVVVRYFEHQMAFEDEEVLRKSGSPRQRHITVWSYALTPQLICGTEMIATVPERIGQQLEGRWPVAVVPFPFDHEPVRVFAYWHQSRESDPVLAAVLRAIRQVVPSAPALAKAPMPSEVPDGREVGPHTP